MRPPLANEALCLSTPKHNGKSGTVDDSTSNQVDRIKLNWVVLFNNWLFHNELIYFSYFRKVKKKFSCNQKKTDNSHIMHTRLEIMHSQSSIKSTYRNKNILFKFTLGPINFNW